MYNDIDIHMGNCNYQQGRMNSARLVVVVVVVVAVVDVVAVAVGC